MPAERPVGADRLTRLDLTDPENVRQATYELSRCLSDFDFARWARSWGQPAIDRCAEAVQRRGEADVTPIEKRLL